MCPAARRRHLLPFHFGVWFGFGLKVIGRCLLIPLAAVPGACVPVHLMKIWRLGVEETWRAALKTWDAERPKPPVSLSPSLPIFVAGCSLAQPGSSMLAAGSSMNAPGCSLCEMGSRPERRMDDPAPEMEHPDWQTCVHERAVEHPALLMGHPGWRSSHPEAFMEHPGRNGAAVFLGRSTIPGRKAVPGGKMGRFGLESGFIAGVGWNGRDLCTDPARALVRHSVRDSSHHRSA